MTFFRNSAVNVLAAHYALRHLASAVAGAFAFVYLLRLGFEVPQALLVYAGQLSVRFTVRPFVVLFARRFGLRRTLMAATVAGALPMLLLSIVDGFGWPLVLYMLVAGIADAGYWTSYHAVFAASGDSEHRGAQLGARAMVTTLVTACGPLIGGLMLTFWGPSAAFGAGSVIAIISVLPLLRLPDIMPGIATSGSIWKTSRGGIVLFAVDGYIACLLAFTWDVIAFHAFGQRFDAFGGMLTAASIAGALAGMVFGRVLDLGHVRHAVPAAVAGAIVLVVLRAVLAATPVGVVIAAILANIFVGIYLPVLMVTVYNAAKQSACPLRFHVLAEGGWDIGAVIAVLLAAAAFASGLPPELILLGAVIGYLAEGFLLRGRYRSTAQA